MNKRIPVVNKIDNAIESRPKAREGIKLEQNVHFRHHYLQTMLVPTNIITIVPRQMHSGEGIL